MELLFINGKNGVADFFWEIRWHLFLFGLVLEELLQILNISSHKRLIEYSIMDGNQSAKFVKKKKQKRVK